MKKITQYNPYLNYYRLACFFLLIFTNHLFYSQCPPHADQNVLPNPSFEDRSCCPSGVDMLACVDEWINGNNTSVDYYNQCGFYIVGRAPTTPVDGDGCIGYLSYLGGGEYVQSCLATPLDPSITYVFSAFVGINRINPGPPKPVTLSLYGSIGDCVGPSYDDALCPSSATIFWEILTEFNVILNIDDGWIYGKSTCFQPADAFDRVIIGTSCSFNGVIDYNFIDLVDLRPCGDSLELEFTVVNACGTNANGSIDLTVIGGTAPYTYDWSNDGVGDNDDDQDLSGLVSGSYQVIVTDANGVTRCQTVFVSQNFVRPTNFSSIPPLCQGDPFIVLPEMSDDTPPVFGSWSPDTIFTDMLGTFTYAFTPDSNFCADSFEHEVIIRRTSSVIDTLFYVGCQNDMYQQMVNGTLYGESNPTGLESFTTAEVCDSMVFVDFIYHATTTSNIADTSCTGSGYSITINATTFDEANPIGQGIVTNSNNCDSIIDVALVFLMDTDSLYQKNICMGSGEVIMINGTAYSEFNPTGMEVLVGANGCDSTVTVDLQIIDILPTFITLSRCIGDGFSIVVNNTVYDEVNPMGTETAEGRSGCDSVIIIDLRFNNEINDTITYSGCIGDGYAITVNSTIYNEFNPTGVELLPSSDGCDTVILIDLVFINEINDTINYSGCIGDGYAVIVNSTVYDETNPSGVEMIMSVGGCDTLMLIDLVFNNEINDTINYSGCIGDGYAVTVNSTVYDETNPSGVEMIVSSGSCDTIMLIDLVFNDEINDTLNYNGCVGDGYAVTINATVYDETNPMGVEMIMSSDGCDTVMLIDLVFNSEINDTIDYNGCTGDGYAVTVNSKVYDETNPNGVEMLMSSGSCDTIMLIDLVFNDEINDTINYSGCMGDGFAVTVNSTVYDEVNPSGVEMLMSIDGCDTVMLIDLVFNNQINDTINYSGCMGDGHTVTVNSTVYDETNPSGVEMLMSSVGCDTVMLIDLVFNSEINDTINYNGCTGDGYAVTVNSTVYDETNPSGVEVLMSIDDCDTVMLIDLVFNSEINDTINYMGCIGDGFAVKVNSTIYDETNPSGVEMIMNNTGCDTVMLIDLEFNSETNDTINEKACMGDGFNITVNSILYNESNPTGIETMMSNGGCDSVITIELSFLAEIERELLYEGCAGDDYFIDVNGSRYDESNPQGIEIISGGANCDTMVSIDFIFHESQQIAQEIELIAGEAYVFDVNSLFAGVDSIVLIDISPTSDVSCSDCVMPIFSSNESQTISILITDEFNCTHTATINFIITSDESVFIPSVFSPNNDGVNDVFALYTGEGNNIIIESLDIYNRWGDAVFSAQNILLPISSVSWDGFQGGKEASEGVYVYNVLLRFGSDLTERRVGDLTLVR